MSEHAPSSTPRARGERGSAAPPRLSPAALPLADAARVLTRLSGRSVTEAMLRADIDAGAPANADGSINLVHYAAWLVKEMAIRGGAGGD